MDILQKLREPRVNIMNIDIAIFDLTASYLGIYLTSKYLLGLKRPGLTSALTFLPISYLAHEYFNVNTPLNDAINSRFNGCLCEDEVVVAAVFACGSLFVIAGVFMLFRVCSKQPNSPSNVLLCLFVCYSEGAANSASCGEQTTKLTVKRKVRGPSGRPNVYTQQSQQRAGVWLVKDPLL